MFGGTSFTKNYEEALFVYVAEAEEEPENKIAPGSNIHPRFQSDYGEKYVGVKQPTIFVVELTKGIVRRWFTDDKGEAFCQPCFRPGTNILAYRKLPQSDLKLGAVYCFNRPATICIDDQVVSASRLARSPSWSPDGKFLCFLSADFATHDGPASLTMYDPKEERIQQIAAGLWGIVKFQHWADDTHLVLNELCRSTPTVSLISTKTKTRTIFRQSATAITAGAGYIILHRQRLSDPGDIVCAALHSSSEQDILVPIRSIGAVLGNYGKDAITEYWTAPEASTSQDSTILSIDNFEAILKLPSHTKERCPLIVMPHGGPHSATRAAYSVPTAFLNARGMASLEINYQGSIGFDSYDVLPGNISTRDVEDCVAATRLALEKFSSILDPDRVAVCGGSHGGFLSGHLAIQYPSIFKVCCMRNPVTNLLTMMSSDIPDWLFVEGLGNKWMTDPDFTFSSSLTMNALDDEALATLRRCSPITKAHTVSVPTLIALGLRDRRCPPSQGLEYFRALPEATPKILLTYPEDDHAIDRPWSTADHWIQIVMWLEKYLFNNNNTT